MIHILLEAFITNILLGTTRLLTSVLYKNDLIWDHGVSLVPVLESLSNVECKDL